MSWAGKAPEGAPRRGTGKPGTVLFAAILLLQVVAVVWFWAFFVRLVAEKGREADAPVPVATPAPTVTPAPTPQTTPTPTPEPAPETVVLAEFPVQGDQIGHLTISGTAVDCDVYFGDSENEFSRGAGIYAGACIPGEGGTILMGAHTGTYFRDLESVAVGTDIAIVTEYGEYHYTVTQTAVVQEDDTTAYDLNATEENIILYTCYPFGILTPTTQRYFVYGDFVSGPALVQE